MNNEEIYCSKGEKFFLTDEQHAALKEYITRNIVKRKTINMNHSSYWYKHVFEDDLGFYISNADCKRAMAECGFRYAFRTGSPNWMFNVSERCLKGKVCRG